MTAFVGTARAVTESDWLTAIPGWRLSRLKWTLTSTKNGTWGDDADGGPDDLLCVRVADFDRQRLCIDLNKPTYRRVIPSQRKGRMLRIGDLLLEKSGGGEKQPVGAVARFDLSEPAVCSNFLARLGVAPSADSRFLAYLHASLYYRRVNERSIKQTTGIQNLDQQMYLDEVAPLPSRSTQTAIANFLDRKTGAIDALIEKKERMIALLAEKRAALVHRAVTKGLNPDVPMKDSGVPALGKVPRHWEIVRNKVVMQEFQAPSTAGEEELLSVSHITGVTRRSEKDVSMFMAEDLSGYKRVTRGDLVINTMWAWMGALGVSPLEGIVSPAYGTYRLDQTRLVPEFYDLFYRTRPYIVEMTRYSRGVWTSRLRLYPEQFLGLLTVIPPTAEQADILRFLEKRTKVLETTQIKLEDVVCRLREYRQTLITAAVTGQFDIPRAV